MTERRQAPFALDDEPVLRWQLGPVRVTRVVEEGLVRAKELFAKRQHDPETMAKFEAGLTDARKNGWSRLGAFDPAERSHALDLFGFEQVR